MDRKAGPEAECGHIWKQNLHSCHYYSSLCYCKLKSVSDLLHSSYFDLVSVSTLESAFWYIMAFNIHSQMKKSCHINQAGWFLKNLISLSFINSNYACDLYVEGFKALFCKQEKVSYGENAAKVDFLRKKLHSAPWLSSVRHPPFPLKQWNEKVWSLGDYSYPITKCNASVTVENQYKWNLITGQFSPLHSPNWWV